MFDIGGPELLVIILAIILLFGPEKMPEILGYVRKGTAKYQHAKNEFTKEINSITESVTKTVPKNNIKE
ncbi:MAG TPA: twin-arginine translocase TatA/TatE family subunit [Candidatus Kapabacteria bacterium]|nr:twin-arginine translocase TatA/TatE family subunit [Candidatus Kapabacteria bacterium]